MRSLLPLAVCAALGCRTEPAHEPATPSPAASVATPTPSPPPAVAPAPAPEEPVATPATTRAHQLARVHVLGDEATELSRVIGSGDAPPWRFVPIAPERGGPALARFHAALSRAQHEPVRIAMYGASGTAADTHTAYVRAYLQQRFGDGGPGWVPLGRATRWSRHAEMEIEASASWRAMHGVRERSAGDGRLGAAGLAFETQQRGAWVELRPRRDRARDVTHVEVFALSQPGGGRFALRIDDGAWREIDGDTPTPALVRVAQTLPPGQHRLRVRTLDRKPVRLLGAVFETDRGVVVDTFGVDGARANNWLRWDAALWREAIAARAPALVTIAYGSNEAVDDEALAAVDDAWRHVVAQLREGAPQADVVGLGPGDFPLLGPQGPQVRPRLVEIADHQRTLAAELGVGYWDELAFMGGPGSMARWVANQPPLARADHLHLLPRGAVLKGQFLCDALMLAHDARASAR